jgi:hypothetical protein
MDRKLTKDDLKAALAHIRNHKDYTSYHVLFALRRQTPDDYANIPASARAQVLTSALVKTRSLNDWGYLDPGESFDDEAAKALVETGQVAIELLRPILDNYNKALLHGSKEAKQSAAFGYRRADFAYRYIVLIRGERAIFAESIDERNRMISKLKEQLKVEKTERK